MHFLLAPMPPQEDEMARQYTQLESPPPTNSVWQPSTHAGSNLRSLMEYHAASDELSMLQSAAGLGNQGDCGSSFK